MAFSRIHVLGLAILGALALVVAGCGGGSKTSGSDIASLDSVHIKRSQFDALIAQAKRNYKDSGRTFPSAGTPEYASIKLKAVTVLVQAAEREVEGKKMGITVTKGQVDKRLRQLKAQYFQGNDDRYQQQLKAQGLTDEQVRDDLKAGIIYQAILQRVTGAVTVADADIHDYYLQHSQNFAKPQSRDVRHILVKSKPLADKLYAQLKAGASFVALAKKYSQDKETKVNGGKLTVSRGSTVKPFDAVAFSLDTNELSKPVKTIYGWHIIQALTPIRPRQVTPEKDVKESIRQQLLQTKKNEAMQAWIQKTDTKLGGNVTYAAGFAPPAAATTTTG